MFDEEGLLISKSRAPVADAKRRAKEREELCRAISRDRERVIQLLRPEILAARERKNIARELFKLVARNRDAEILPCHIFDFVRFVENHRAVVRNDAALFAADRPALHREVREKQMMIHDDDVAGLRHLMHFRDEAAFELGAFLS